MTSSGGDKNTCKVSKRSAKTVGGVAFTRFDDMCDGQ